jgi:hypothetical protein
MSLCVFLGVLLGDYIEGVHGATSANLCTYVASWRPTASSAHSYDLLIYSAARNGGWIATSATPCCGLWTHPRG